MTYSSWEELHDALTRCPWFAHVARPTSRDGDPDVRRVASWVEAVVWASDQNSWWCANEASNVLRLHLHTNHNREYQAWNRHITSFQPARSRYRSER